MYINLALLFVCLIEVFLIFDISGYQTIKKIVYEQLKHKYEYSHITCVETCILDPLVSVSS